MWATLVKKAIFYRLFRLFIYIYFLTLSYIYMISLDIIFLAQFICVKYFTGFPRNITPKTWKLAQIVVDCCRLL